MSYAVEHGLPVFPVKRDKTPYTDNGFKNATADKAKITEFWTKWPAAGIGMPTGAASGLIAIDIDPRHGGDVTLEENEKKLGALPRTLESLTGGGGRHLFFLYPGVEIKTRAAALGPGFDVRGDGGYVVLPPSMHSSGRAYEWEGSSGPEQLKPTILPDVWLRALQNGTSPHGPTDEDGTERAGVNPAEVLRGIEEGERDERLFKYACSLRRRWFPRVEAEALVLLAARECKPPFPESEARRKVEQAWKFPAGDGRPPHRNEQPSAAPTASTAEAHSAEQSSRSLVEVMASMPLPGERLPTGIPALDRCLRGGAVTGRVYGFVAPPNRGKTAGVAQLAREGARRHGITAACLFADEGDWQAALMILEGLGFKREDLEDRFAKIRDDVALRSAALDIRLFNPDMTLEAVVARLDADGLAGERVILVADSAQRVRTETGEQSESAKERADAFMKLCRGIVKTRPRWIVLFTSKANRASWAKRDPSDRLDYLAAGLDSSAIEYESDFLAFLEGDTETGITMHVMKNRPGDGSLPSIRLRYDRERATFSEVDAAAAESQAEDERRQAAEAEWSALEDRVVDGLKRYPGKTGNALRKLLKINRGDLGAVLEELERKGKARHETKGRAQFWFPGVSSEEDDL